MARAAHLVKGDEVFTWENPGGRTMSFAVSMLNRLLAEASPQVHVLAYPENFGDWLVANRSADIDRARELTPEQLAQPVTVLEIDGQTLLVDGTQRTYARYLDGLREGPAYIVPETVWRFFVIEDSPHFTTEQIKALPTDGLSHRKKGNK